MNIEVLLVALEEREISLAVDGNDLVVTAVKGVMTEDLKNSLLQNKSALIKRIRSGNRLLRKNAKNSDASVPPNAITPHSTTLTPAMLPLIDLAQPDIDRIVAQVPGGIANIQDIYALSPLQDGILFHHLLATDGDPYLQVSQMAFTNRALLDRYLDAVQQVVDRHDILRTAFTWEQLPTPAQVVWRHAPLSITEVHLDPQDGSAHEQLARHFDSRHHRLDLTQAPLLRFIISQEPRTERWLLLQLQHHLIGDHSTLDVLNAEVQFFLAGQGHRLSAPQPFRHLIAQTRLGMSPDEHERFFRSMLADIDEPTTPFGLIDIHRDGSRVGEAHRLLPQALNDRLRTHARRLGVSLASLCHLAWGQVLARTSGREQVVFGTVLFGRMHAGEGADRAMGLFINTLPLRLDLDSTDVETSVRRTHTRLAELLRHEHASLALAQRCSGVVAPAPLFSSLLNYRHQKRPTASGRNAQNGTTDPLHGVEWLGGEERTNYPFVLSVEDFGHALGLTVQVVQPLAPERVCAFMQRTLEQLVDALEQAPHTPVRQLDVLPTEERTLLLETWNQTDAPYPDHLCIHQLFEQQVLQRPHATALVFEEQSLSYNELNTRANQLAHHLIALGVRPDQRVAICVERSLTMVIGLLAILKAGGAYMPLDPAYPVERLTQILLDATPLLLLSDAAGRAALDDESIAQLTVIEVDASHSSWTTQPTTNPDPHTLGLTSNHLAYVIYTSGSTGTPKGAQNEHKAVINRLTWMQDTYGLNADDTVLQKTPFSFDVSVWEFFWTLLNGATLILAAPEAHKDGFYLIGLITQHRVTTTHFVPSMLSSFLETEGVTRCTSLRRMICSGEALPASSIHKCRQALPHAELYNLYGPTEAAIDVTAWTCPAEFDALTVPIGRPIANTRIYLLDAYGQPVPLGVTGELYIGGAGVARGYLNRPDLTAERFLTDPFSTLPGARMYKTGDLARYLPDGNLEFLGRNDHQVKIRGFRIELGEIEARLTEHPAVREAIVLAREDVPGDQRLVAYVVPTADDTLEPAEWVAALRIHLTTRLPDYMVPAAFVRLDTLPLTPSGKLDRKALPAPEGDAYARHTYAPPQGEIETALAQLWEELLGVPQVSRHDNFFELGGHSLLAVQLMERLRRLGLGVEVRTLFATPTLADLATTLGSHREVAAPPNAITPHSTTLTPAMLPLIDLAQPDIDRIVAQVPGGIANIQDIYALSPLQDGILFHHLLATDGDPYLQVSQMAFTNRALLDRYLDAVQQVVDRHDILRTAFTWEQLPTPAQVVWRHAPLSITEVHLDPQDGSAHEQLARHFDSRHHRLDLTQAPLLRFIISQEPRTERWLLLQLQHHLIGDHSTLDVLNAEVQFFLAGQGHRLSAPQPFRHLIAQTRLGMSPDEHERFFRSMLADIDEPTTPFGLIDIHRDGSRVGEAHRLLPQALNDRLRTHARRLGVSLASLCHLAWGQVLARTSGREQVVFGTVLFGRMHAGEGADRAMGLFINTLPLRLDLDSTDVETSVRRTHTRLAELLRHEHASLALAQRCSGVVAPAPLFSSLLNYRHQKRPTASGRNAQNGTTDPLHGVEWLGGEERTNYPFVLSVEDFGHALGLTVQVVQPLAPERVCAFMQRTLEQLVDALEQAPHTPVRQLDVLPTEERTLLLETWNQTDAPYPDHLCIHQLFEQQVLQRPHATALVFEEQSLSYNELNTRANQLAHHLIALGVRPDQRVAICVERSLTMVIGLLAILKAGGAYMPLDPAYPVERLTQILLDATPLLLLSDAAGRAALDDESIAQLTVIEVDASHSSWTTQPTTNPDPHTLGLTSNHLAYVIYTSGSTGTPKGVMVEHRGVINHIVWQVEQFGFNECDAFSQRTSIAFDASGWELWTPVSIGARLVLLSTEVQRNAHATFMEAAMQGVTIIQTVPSLLAALSNVATTALNTDTLRYLFCGGEPLNRKLHTQYLHLAKEGLINLYGPTEATIDTTAWQTDGNPIGLAVPIGRPIANTRIYLLDAYGQPVPLGVTGELYIGGAGVARGYLNRPDLTAERFLTDPFSTLPGARMYKTGDLARYLPDGNLEFLGRNDHQVKIRGFRIELGEIEARLTEHPAVREAIVLAREDVPGDQRLVAYVVPTADDTLEPAEWVAALRIHLTTRLPDYMVPAAFVRLDTLPLTPSGKLDRKALPAPEGDAYARHTYAPPQGEIETALAQLWEELLGVPQVSRHDNFFELGGHSLLAVRLLSRLPQAVSVTLPLATLFAHPTLTALAFAVTHTLEHTGVQALPPIIPAARDGQLPLSFAQQRLWFLAQLDERISATYHIPMALHLHGPLDTSALYRSLDALWLRHEALRTIFAAADGQPHVALLSPELGFPLIEHDLQNVADASEQLASLCVQEATASFDLTQGPLVRSRLIHLAEHDHILLLTQHHIVSDGWSIGVLIRELSTLYTAFTQGHADPLVPLAIQYPDYAAWQRQWLAGERLATQVDYWRQTLADVPVLLDLPTDRPRPPQQSFAGAFVPIHLDTQLTQDLKRLSQQHDTTLFMTLMAAWAAVLARLCGQDDLVIGTPTANRNRAEIEPLIGFFVNTLALRIDLSGEPSVADLLARVRHTALAAQDHQDLPFEQVVEIVQPPRRLEHTPLFQVMFAWQNNEGGTFDLHGLHVEPARMPFESVKFDLELGLGETDNGIIGSLRYASALFDAPTIERHRGYLINLLHAMVADAKQAVARIDLLDAAERTLLLETWNQTDAPYPDHLCIHQLFEQQVLQRPHATALVFEEQSLSYNELNTRANQLAHHLIALGVRPDQRVAICVERSLTMVIGLLAILKAGGAYMPLDPAYPVERLTQILLDATPLLLLSDAAGRAALDDESIAQLTVIEVDASHSSWTTQPTTNPDPHTLGLTSNHLAYVIYTSGSTGTPKGVMVEHRGVINHIVWQVEQFGFNECDAFSQRTSIAFDASGWELWTPVSIGARLVLLSTEIQRNAHATFMEAAMQGVTIIQTVPSLLAALSNVATTALNTDTLRYLFCGGEPLNRKLHTQYLHLAKEGLINLYGPTEATIDTTAWQTDGNPIGLAVPIGRPIANTRIYLLDAYGQPVPLGVTGELYIGGAGVARGYLNRPDLTAERFLTDPFSTLPGARMYKTGDLARYLPDGNLEFLGRNDHQVKIRGFRIELGEIEARLTEHPAVREAIVLAREDVPGDQRLVAYVVPTADDTLEPAEWVAALRIHLTTRLPDYMVPAAFVRLDTLPLTPSGKLDRKALPAPEGDAYARHTYAPPQGEIETALAQLWEELLGVPQISRHDNFFELGGHSLLAVRLASRMADKGFTFTIDQLFQSPTMQDLAMQITDNNHSLYENRAIQVRHSGNQTPIFFVPTGLGHYSYVFELVRDLDDDIPVYALPWQSAYVAPLQTMEAMATRMVTMIRAIQPKGPYRLAGYSSGGVLAYAIAQHLLGIDETVSFIGLIDVALIAEKLSKSPITAKQILLDKIELLKSSENFEAFRQLADDISLIALIEQNRVLNANSLSEFRDAEDEAKFYERAAHFISIIYPSYEAPSLPVVIHQFHATDLLPPSHKPGLHDKKTTVPSDDAEKAPQQLTLGWELVLPRSSIHLIPIPGDHLTIMKNPTNRTILGTLFSKTLRAQSLIQPNPGPLFNPLIPLHATYDSKVPLLYVPGAGASITSVMEFIGTLDERWPVYGLQPRGIDPSEQPHTSIEASATCNLNAMNRMNLTGPVHLLGHSNGGSVVFEMALRLQEQGRSVRSVTLIDSPPPDAIIGVIPDITEHQIFKEFVGAIRWTFDEALDIDENLLTYCKTASLISNLHAAMVSARLLHTRSDSAMLRGPLAAFAASRRSSYFPTRTYAGKIRLALVRDPLLNAADDIKQRQDYVVGWQRWVTELDVWNGPGHHYSILRAPHVQSLANWWRQAIN